jgi:hypothetical protein
MEIIQSPRCAPRQDAFPETLRNTAHHPDQASGRSPGHPCANVATTLCAVEAPARCCLHMHTSACNIRGFGLDTIATHRER